MLGQPYRSIRVLPLLLYKCLKFREYRHLRRNFFISSNRKSGAEYLIFFDSQIYFIKNRKEKKDMIMTIVFYDFGIMQ